jgi:hypothetical protein
MVATSLQTANHVEAGCLPGKLRDEPLPSGHEEARQSVILSTESLTTKEKRQLAQSVIPARETSRRLDSFPPSKGVPLFPTRRNNPSTAIVGWGRAHLRGGTLHARTLDEALTPDQIILVLGDFRGGVWLMALDPHSSTVAG